MKKVTQKDYQSFIQIYKGLEKPRDFDPFGHAGLSPLVTI